MSHASDAAKVVTSIICTSQLKNTSKVQPTAGALSIMPCHDGMCEIVSSALQGSGSRTSYGEQVIAWHMHCST